MEMICAWGRCLTRGGRCHYGSELFLAPTTCFIRERLSSVLSGLNSRSDVHAAAARKSHIAIYRRSWPRSAHEWGDIDDIQVGRGSQLTRGSE
jgi:hypothetical protein